MDSEIGVHGVAEEKRVGEQRQNEAEGDGMSLESTPRKLRGTCWDPGSTLNLVLNENRGSTCLYSTVQTAVGTYHLP